MASAQDVPDKPKSKKEIIFQKELSNGDKVEMEKKL